MRRPRNPTCDQPTPRQTKSTCPGTAIARPRAWSVLQNTFFSSRILTPPKACSAASHARVVRIHGAAIINRVPQLILQHLAAASKRKHVRRCFVSAGTGRRVGSRCVKNCRRTKHRAGSPVKAVVAPREKSLSWVWDRFGRLHD